MQQITWLPVVIFVGVLAVYALVDHLRTHGRKRSSRTGFRRMQSPYARPRNRSAHPSSRATFTQPYHAAARRTFTR